MKSDREVDVQGKQEFISNIIMWPCWNNTGLIIHVGIINNTCWNIAGILQSELTKAKS